MAWSVYVDCMDIQRVEQHKDRRVQRAIHNYTSRGFPVLF